MSFVATENYRKAMEYRNIIDILLAENRYCDLVLTGGKVINVLTREIYSADIAVNNGYIVMVGNCNGLIGPNTTVVNVEGSYLAPGFIDSHMHFESSMLTIHEFSRFSLATGTTTLVADPHEIGNALGPRGIEAMSQETQSAPSRVYLVPPALTPDSPGLETCGYDITSQDMAEILNYPGVIGIGELQGFSNVKNVYQNTPEVITDLLASTSYARNNGQVVDGNAPELFGEELAAHILSTGGDCSCHETTTKEECVEKLRYGVYVFIREGSTQKNMSECVRAITEEGLDSRRMILSTDDMVADDLYRLGHMNEIVKRTIDQGIEPAEAIQMVTINPASYFGFHDRGVLAPGKLADITVIDNLEKMQVAGVFLGGELVAESGELLNNLTDYKYPQDVKSSVIREPVEPEDLAVTVANGSRQVTARCIGLIPDQNLTDSFEEQLPVQGNTVNCAPDRDINHVASLERYGRNGSIGTAFIKGFGLQRGAFCESVSHDSHNLIVVGASLKDMAEAVNAVINLGGGIAVVKDGRVLEELALPIGGLMTDELKGDELSARLDAIERAITKELGCKVHEPLMHLSFTSLSTSPEWKITDQGLLDVNKLEIIPSIKE